MKADFTTVFNLFLEIVNLARERLLSASAGKKGAGQTPKPTHEKPETSLLFSDRTAKCSSSARFKNCVSISAKQTVEQLGGRVWIAVEGACWSKRVQSSFIAMSNSITLSTGGKYRLKTVFKITKRDDKKEVITVYSRAKNVK